MKAALVALLLVMPAFAQNPLAGGSVVCGSGDVRFKVKLDYIEHASAQREPGKALVYFIHDAGTSAVLAYPTTKIAVDGAWVGADHSNSYFSVSVEPGEHHVCATLQSSLVDNRAEFAQFTAQAGRVYFYRTRLVMSREVELLELDLIDSDQGAYLISVYPLSVSHPTKQQRPTVRYSGTKASHSPGRDVSLVHPPCNIAPSHPAPA
jgi:hypothetical protein